VLYTLVGWETNKLVGMRFFYSFWFLARKPRRTRAREKIKGFESFGSKALSLTNLPPQVIKKQLKKYV
jgi:hypothetical protein